MQNIIELVLRIIYENILKEMMSKNRLDILNSGRFFVKLLCL